MMKTTHILSAVMLLLFSCLLKVRAAEPWPAEPWTSAKTLTHLDPAFRNNMSGAFYNPKTETFWVCCNGGPSAFWALKKDEDGGWAIATKGEKQAKFNLGRGDLEGICQVDYGADTVYLMVERADHINEYDVSDYGAAKLKNSWDVSAHVPTKDGAGSEGIVFVPDEWLKKDGFTDADGKPYASKGGMGGLMFVAHQYGGRIYVFDLSVGKKDVHFVGAYKTSRRESSGLEFDRTSGLLYIWHNTGVNFLEVTKLSSYTDANERRLSTVTEFIGPKKGNLEGIAISPGAAKDGLCLVVDDNNHQGAALMFFSKFNPAEAIQKALAEQENQPAKK